MNQQLTQLALVAGVVMALLGVPMVLIGTIFRRRIKGFNSRAAAVMGTVVDNEQHYSTSGAYNRRIHFPLVEFVTQQGQTVRVKALGQGEPMPIGTAVQLFYDPSNADDVSFTGPRGQAGIASTLWLLGLFLLLGGLGVSVASMVL